MGQFYQFYEVYDPNLILIKNATSSAILDKHHILLGTDDGLYSLNIIKDEIVQLTDKKVLSICLLPGFERHGTFSIISGSKRLVRTITYSNKIEQIEPVKIEETRQAIAIQSKL